MKIELWTWMEQHGVYLEHLAFRAGLHAKTVRRWLNGQRVSEKTRDKIIDRGLRGVGCPREIREKFKPGGE